MNKKVAQAGSVSSGTMREQDLVPGFLGVLEEFNPHAHSNICLEIIRAFGRSLNTICEHDNDPAWNSEEMSFILNEDIWDAMQEIAPKGCYFGSHPGDGADYGFWSCEMALI